MNERIDLLLWDGPAVSWPHGQVRRLPGDVGSLSATLAELAEPREAAWWLFWDSQLGPPPAALVPELVADRADALHAGLRIGTAGLPEDVDLVQPTWWFNADPPARLQAASWRVSLRACLVRVDVMRVLGGPDPAFLSVDAAALDLGWRWLARGAIVVHEPRLVPAGTQPSRPPLPRRDRHLFLLRHYPRKWARYAAVRRALRGRPFAEVAAFRDAARIAREVPPPASPSAVYARPAATSGADVVEPGRVSVVLPTLGRPQLVSDVLADLTRQTVPAWQVICVDQNGTGPGQRDYHEFAKLPLAVIHQEPRGQWTARNAAIERATGDLLLFLDDDSRIDADFIEQHLRALARYRADVSAGASHSTVGAPVPANYGFFRAADQFDSGNALVRRGALEQVGAFDRQYDKMRSGDADFGTRLTLAGGILVHNPLAMRVHLKAAEGGLRSFGSWDTFRQRGLLTPRPLPSVHYYACRHFSGRQAREALLIGLAQSIVPYHLKRQATPRQWASAMAAEAVLLPVTALRVARSLAAARRMLGAGPKIPPVPAEVGA